MLKIFPGAPHDELTVVISSAEALALALALAQALCGSVPLRDTEYGAGLRRPALASAGVTIGPLPTAFAGRRPARPALTISCATVRPDYHYITSHGISTVLLTHYSHQRQVSSDIPRLRLL